MANLTLLQLTTRRQLERQSLNKSPHYLPDIESLNDATISLIREEFLRQDKRWFLGFSGGKDSSALLKLVYLSLVGLPRDDRPTITVVYCDTGVDIPIVTKLVRATLRSVKAESELAEVPIDIELARPPLRDRYFVKLIGKGYPPPSNKFRWCTDRLRIDPVQRVINDSAGKESIVLLGVRQGESIQRDRTLKRNRAVGDYFLSQTGKRNTLIFSPILDYKLEDVWATITRPVVPVSIDAVRLTKLYKDAAGECPSIRDPRGTPCGKGRFGCWTCTVVRKDRAMTNMILEGHYELEPLLHFRNWLMTIRDDSAFRCSNRRNGQQGMGPFTLKGRRVILRKLLSAQRKCAWPLIQKREIAMIKQLWKVDSASSAYRSLEVRQ